MVKRNYSEDSVDCDDAVSVWFAYICIRESRLLSCGQSIQCVDYENELDLMAVTSVTSGPDCYQGHVHLHDNQSGKLLQTFTLEESWFEVYK